MGMESVMGGGGVMSEGPRKKCGSQQVPAQQGFGPQPQLTASAVNPFQAEGACFRNSRSQWQPPTDGGW